MFGPSITAAYATQALICLARDAEGAQGSEAIASQAGVPLPYLRKILHTLRGEGLVTTRRGSGGGYRLARSPETITLFDVLSAVDGSEPFERCLLGLGKCSPERGCPVHPLWSEQRKRVRARYRELTLRDLSGFDRFDFERDYYYGCNGKRIARASGRKANGTFSSEGP